MRVLWCVSLLLLAACASSPSPDAPSVPAVAPEAMVATIRAAAGDADDELAVQPLRDPMVEDLRRRALQAEQARRYQDAADALDQALAVTQDDTAVLKVRAEEAIMLGVLADSETFATNACT